MVKCCDFFQSGSGYEFTECEDLGAFIRTEMIGSQLDIFYAQQPLTAIAFNNVWQDFNNLLDNICT